MPVVVDTDVASFFFKKDTRAEVYEPYLRGELPFLSFMTVAELQRWSISRGWSAPRHAKLRAFFARHVIVHSNEPMCEMWAHVVASALGKGRPISTADAWVASTALLYGFPLVTHNARHFQHVEGLTVLTA